jgi:hypothetical protein
MQRVLRIALPKERLQKLTAGERSLFLLEGHVSNQINALWKLVCRRRERGNERPGSGKGVGGPDPDRRAAACDD